MIKQSDRLDDSSDSEDTSDNEPSKSQRKRDALKAVELAKALLQLSPGKRDRFGLTSEITDALKLADEIRSNGAKKRQLHYIGKLLRGSADYDAYWEKHEHPQNLPAPRSETPDVSEHLQMRDRLLEDLAGTMTDLRSQYPTANTQLIRQLVNRIHKSTTNNASETDSNHAKLLQALTTALVDGKP